MCRIYLEFVKKGTSNGEIYNAGYEYKTALDFAEDISKKTNAKITRVETRDQRSYRTCSEKLENDLSFEYSYDSSDAITELAEAFKEGIVDREYSVNIQVVKELLKIT